METRARTMVKAILWTCIGLVSMMLVGWVATGSIALGGGMALINSALGLACYVLYERLWAQIAWGRNAR